MFHDDGSYAIFMTPEDFVRSLTPGVMQPRRYGLDKFKTYNPRVSLMLKSYICIITRFRTRFHTRLKRTYFIGWVVMD
jgi:hypothetical protein